MAEGAWATAAATAAAALLYACATVAALRRPRPFAPGRSAVPALFACITYFLALAALRQAAAALSLQDPSFEKVDLALFLLLLVPAGLAVVPLVYVLAAIRSSSRAVPRVVAGAWALVIGVGLAFAYMGGIKERILSAWGSDWTLADPVARVLLVVAIFVPSIGGSAWMMRLGQDQSPGDRRRLRMVGASCLVYFTVFTIDAFALAGVWLFAARVATAAAGWLAWRAYAKGPAEDGPPVEGPST